MQTLQLRDQKGRFIPGVHISPATEFKKGQHWRSPKPYWNRDWLYNEYTINGKDIKEIAKEYGCDSRTVSYFLRKHNITTRSMSEIRKQKHWGSSGILNPMFGKFGELNPNWNGGHSPERQSLYARSMWKRIRAEVVKRDNYRCRDCGERGNVKDPLQVHHIKPWAKYPVLRFMLSNLLTLHKSCHKRRHRYAI